MPRNRLGSTRAVVPLLALLLGLLAGCGGGDGGHYEPAVQTGTRNAAPISAAGADRTVTAGDAVTLDGYASSDPDGDALTFAWTQTSGTAVALSGASSARLAFTAPAVGAAGEDLVFTLIVADRFDHIASDSVTVHVAPAVGGNRAPVAAASANGSALAGDPLVLDGTQSRDPDGGALTYLWTQTAGTDAGLADNTSATAHATAPTPAGGAEDLVFELTVTDPEGLFSKASATVHVGTTPVQPAATTPELIDKGVADPEQRLMYKVFAVFNDSRLPAEYRGSETDLASATGIMMELAQKYESLSQATKEVVYPFLLPAYVKNSWYDRYPRPLERAGRAGRASRTAAVTGAPSWKWVTNGKVKVWYDEDLSVTYGDGSIATFAQLAQGILDAVGGTIWDKLQKLMDKEPTSDLGVAAPALPNPNYGYAPGNLDASGALDIVLAHGMNASGYTHPSKSTDPTPSFITIDAVMWPLGDEKTPGLIQIVAHELMHSWQFSYPKKENRLTYYWVMEATAAWTEDYVYPDANSENRYAAWFLDSTRLPADDETNLRQYGLYTAFSYWTNGDTAKAPPEMVKTLWENAGSMSSIEAVDESYPPPLPIPMRRFTSFFERYWTDALAAAWNRGADGYFFKKDKLTAGAKVAPNKTTTVALGGETEKMYFLDDLDGSGKVELPYLSGRYYHFVFPEDSARTVMIHDGLRVKLDLIENEDGTRIYAGPAVVDPDNPLVDPVEGAEWRVLTKIGGEWSEWRPESAIEGQSLYGSMPALVSFCRDVKAERVEELVVLLANSAPDKSVVVKPPYLAPLVLVSNLGCYGWEGTITATDDNGYTESTTAQVTWGRVKEVYPEYDPYGLLPPGAFALKKGRFTTQIGGRNGDCTHEGSDSWTWDAATDSIFESPDASLGMIHQAVSGTMYRTYDGHGGAGTHEVSYQVTCPNSTTTETTVPTWWNASPGTPLPPVSSDGTALQGSAESGSTRYEWNLRAIREP